MSAPVLRLVVLVAFVGALAFALVRHLRPDRGIAPDPMRQSASPHDAGRRGALEEEERGPEHASATRAPLALVGADSSGFDPLRALLDDAAGGASLPGRVLLRIVVPDGRDVATCAQLARARVQVDPEAGDAIDVSGFDRDLTAVVPGLSTADAFRVFTDTELVPHDCTPEPRVGAPVLPSWLTSTERRREGNDVVVDLHATPELWGLATLVDETGAPVVGHADTGGWHGSEVIPAPLASRGGRPVYHLDERPGVVFVRTRFPYPDAFDVVAHDHLPARCTIPPGLDPALVADLGRVVLERAPLFEILVLRPDGSPAVDFLVERYRHRRPMDGEPTGVRTDATGRCRMRSAPRANVRLWGHSRDATDPLHLPRTDVDISSGEVVLQLERAPVLTLEFDANEPRWNGAAAFQFLPLDSVAQRTGFDRSSRTWDGTTVRFDDARPGKWMLLVSRGSGDEVEDCRLEFELHDTPLTVEVPYESER
ncbi:MAG: hypothetical protein AAFU73_20545 [Planctomycetota bacterium]